MRESGKILVRDKVEKNTSKRQSGEKYYKKTKLRKILEKRDNVDKNTRKRQSGEKY